MATTNLGEALIKIKVQVDGMGKVVQLQKGLGGLTKKTQRFGRQLKSSGKNVQAFVQRIRQVSFVLRDAGRQFALFGAAIGGGLLAITAEGAKFQQGMADIKAVVDDLSDGTAFADAALTKLEGTLLDVAGATVFTAKEVAGAAKQLGLAGLSAKEIEDSIQQIADLAAASDLNIADTALTAATIMRGFGIEAAEVGRVSDTLTAIFTNTNTTLATLKESFKLATPAANAFGISLEETAVAMGILGDTGLRGSIAGTGFSRLVNQLATDTDKLNELLNKVGSNASKVDPLAVGLQAAVKEMRDLLVAGKLTQSQLADTFDQRALRVLLNLISQGDEAFDALNDKLERSAGLTERVAAVKLDTVIGQFKLLKSEISALATAIFSSFSDELQSVIELFKEWVVGLREWVQQNEETVNTLVRITVAISALALGIGITLLVVGSLVAIMSALVLVVLSLAAAFAVLDLAMLPFIIAGALVVAALLAIAIAIAAAIILVVAFSDKIAAATRKLLQFFGLIRRPPSRSWIRDMTTDFSDLNDQIKESSAELSKFLREAQQFAAILAKGGLASQAELERAKKLAGGLGGGTSKGLTAKTQGLRDAISRGEEVRERLQKAIDGISGKVPDVLKDALVEVTARIEAATVKLEAFDDVIEKVASQERFAGSSLGLDKTRENVNAEITSLLDELDVLNVRLAGARAVDLPAIVVDIELNKEKTEQFKDQLTFLASFNKETFEVFRQAFSDTGILDKAIQAVIDHKDAIQADIQAAEALKKVMAEVAKEAKKAFEELAKIEERLNTDLNTALENQITALEEQERAVRATFKDAAGGLVLFDPAALLLASRLQKALEKLQLLRDKGIKTRNTDRDAEITSLKKDRARAAKDAVELETLIRDERKLERDKEIDSGKFSKPASAGAAEIKEIERDRLEFIKEFNLETERTVDEMKKQLAVQAKTVKTGQKIALASSQRNKDESSITRELIKQVKTLDDARAASRFLRGEERRRLHEAAVAGKNQEKVEARLLESIKKREQIVAFGGDTTKIDSRIRRQKGLVDQAQKKSVLKDGTAGFKSIGLKDFDAELKAAAAAGKAAAAVMKQNIIRFGMFTVALDTAANKMSLLPDQMLMAWTNSLQNMPAPGPLAPVPTPSVLPQTFPSLTPAGGSGAVVATGSITDNRKIDIIINSDQDPTKIAEAVFDKLSRAPLGAGPRVRV